MHTDDLAFVKKVVSGDGEAAELFLYRCQIWTGQLARMSNVPSQEWGDLAQEALLIALGQMRRGLFRGDSSFQTWVEKIIRGKIADYWRAHQKDGALVPIEPDASRLGENGWNENIARQVALIQSLAARQTDPALRMMVREALRAMSAQHAMILLLNAREGYSIAEIGHRLDMPQGTVGRKLAEAKAKFRRSICDPPNETTLAATGIPPEETPRNEVNKQPGNNPAERRIGLALSLSRLVFVWQIPTPLSHGRQDAPRLSFIKLSPITVSAKPMRMLGA